MSRRWTYLGLAVGIEVSASLLLKAAGSVPALYLLVVIGYVVSFALLSLTMRHGMGIGSAYAIWGALGIVLTAVLSAAVYDERFTAPMGFGIGLVVAGVVAVEGGAHHARAAAALNGEVAP